MYNVNDTGDLFKVIVQIDSLSKLDEDYARTQFEEYQAQKVIKADCNFEDNIWYTTDEYSNVGLHFKISVGTYDKHYKKVFGCSHEVFVLKTKIFVTSLFGKIVLESIQAFVQDIVKLTQTPIDSVLGDSVNFTLYRSNLCTEFFSMFSKELGEDNELLNELIEGCEHTLDYLYDGERDKQRTLADMKSYFLFGHIIEDYWNSALKDEDRLFYFPLYLWWKLTGVIPQRPREFLLLSRDCLIVDANGNYKIKLMRNRLKGSKDGNDNNIVTYKIEDDYDIDIYPIPYELGETIEKYKLYTSDYEATELNTLFISDPHYKHFGHKKHQNSRYLTYMNLNTILRCFYKDVISNIYGYKVLFETNGDALENDEISYIHLGDSRHIALINIVAEGGNPVIAAMLAGHASPTMSAHYFTNLTFCIECKVYIEYTKRLQGETKNLLTLKKNLPQRLEYSELQDGSYCYSDKYLNQDFADCYKSVGPDGELMYCPTCPYNRKELGFFNKDEIYKNNIKAGVEDLEMAINAVRAGKGFKEEISDAMQRLSQDCNNYKSYYEEQLIKATKGEM